MSLRFLGAIVDSWDGDGCFAGPDLFNVTVDGHPILSDVFENSGCGIQTYVPPPGVELARRLDLGFSVGDPFYMDSAYDFGLDPAFQTVPHSASTVTIDWFASGDVWQGDADESWAIDNVEVILNDVTTPGGCFDIVALGGSYTSTGVKAQVTYADPTCQDLVYDTFVYDEPGDIAPIAGQGRLGTGARSLDFGGGRGLKVRGGDPDGDVVVCTVVWSKKERWSENVLDAFGYPNAPKAWDCQGLELRKTSP
jgi:hypothetical protein